jgi:hypothetical protein
MRLSLLLTLLMTSAAGAATVPLDPPQPAESAKPKLFGPVAAKVDAPAPPAVDEQDYITLDNKQQIYGTILDSSNDDIVDLNTGSGMVRIPKSKVKWPPFYGLISQRKRMAHASLSELVAFAKWCDSSNHRADALSALDRAVGLPGVNADIIGMHARLVDESTEATRGPQNALPLYRKYKDAGGSDKDLLARLSQLEDVLAEHNQKLQALNLPPVDVDGQATAVIPATVQPPLADNQHAGMEAKGSPFQSEELQWSLPVETTLTNLPPEEGGAKVLLVTSTGVAATPPANGKKAPEKVAIKKSIAYAIDESNSNLSFQVRNRTGHPLSIAVALKTGDHWTFYESVKQVVVPNPEFKTLNYDLKAATFKCDASKWKPTGSIVDLDQVKELQLLIYNDGNNVDLAIQGMQLGKAPEL